MARQVSLTTLRQRVRWRTDTENETARFPDTELDDCINEGIAQYHAERIRSDAQGFADSETTFTTVSGTELYALPAEFLEVTHVSVTVDGRDRDLRLYDQWELETLSAISVRQDADFGFYRLVGDNISLKPTPKRARVVRVKFKGTAVRLTAPSNTVDGVVGLEEFIVAWASQRLAIKDRNWDLKGILETDKQEILDRMRAIDANRNASEPTRMADAAGRLRNNRPWCRWGSRRGL